MKLFNHGKKLIWGFVGWGFSCLAADRLQFFYLTKIWLSQVDAISNTSVSKDSQNLTESYQAFILTYADFQTYCCMYTYYKYIIVYKYIFEKCNPVVFLMSLKLSTFPM